MEQGPDRSEGLGKGMHHSVRALVGLVRSRIELVAVELGEERVRLVVAVGLACFAASLAFGALLLLTLAVVAAIGTEHRAMALAGAAILYAGGATFIGFRLRSALKTWQPFQATREEFARDQSALEGEP